jgi:t-SNARE complex subunit (syntaxin)
MSTDKINKIETALNETSKILEHNIEIAINRSENLEQLELKTVKLESDSKIFKKVSKSLRQKLCADNVKKNCIIFGLLMIPVLLVIISVCASGKC